MFTQPCLIRKNTERLRDKLRMYGYKIPFEMFFENRQRGILCNKKIAVGVPDDSWEYNLDKYLKDNPDIIDCGTNEDLFFAIAALRDDSDKYQWFAHNAISFFIRCTYEGFHFFVFNPMNALGCKDTKNEFHKATVQELVEHFKK